MRSMVDRSSQKMIPVRKIGRRRVVDRVAEILQLCRDKRVLHLGCADYPFAELQGENFLHEPLSHVARELWGIDLSEEGVRALQAQGFSNLVVGDVEDPQVHALLPGDFNVIVAGELIEHLASPGDFLTSIRQLMGSDTELLLTTPNACTLKGVIHALVGQEKVHPDHNYYFSHFTIQQLLEKFGYRCVESYYYQEVRGRGLSLIVDRLFGVSAKVWPLLADGLIVRAKRVE